MEKIISLDSLRYPFPSSIPILSLRAVDTKADEGVLPKSGAEIVGIPFALHADMCDGGPILLKNEIINLILKFLKDKT